ncbi:hypothetical protein XELAEV_18010768mg [Xenopus laevis]|uniref:Uncharacterized protein n=1 Tax=Xenopus laevis TaxID=8355 RepID=A0A974DXC5_XENLA|nr:hypothetical protein XELAEV_18010768mg [Xenopus laevis]
MNGSDEIHQFGFIVDTIQKSQVRMGNKGVNETAICCCVAGKSDLGRGLCKKSVCQCSLLYETTVAGLVSVRIGAL